MLSSSLRATFCFTFPLLFSVLPPLFLAGHGPLALVQVESVYRVPCVACVLIFRTDVCFCRNQPEECQHMKITDLKCHKYCEPTNQSVKLNDLPILAIS